MFPVSGSFNATNRNCIWNSMNGEDSIELNEMKLRNSENDTSARTCDRITMAVQVRFSLQTFKK